MKPIIGITPLWDESKNSIWIRPGYPDSIIQSGGIPLLLPLLTDSEDLKRLIAMCSGILFTGGPDVAPELYGEESLGEVVIVCEKRDETERIILKEAMRQKKPILGICRGIQLINVALGGSLYQDIPLQYPTDVVHGQEPPFDAPSHKVNVTEGSPLWACFAGGSQGDFLQNGLPVNSCHHQAVKRLADGLEVMAVSEDGLIEAYYLPDYPFLWAVQWHPEMSFHADENSRKIFCAFMDAMS